MTCVIKKTVAAAGALLGLAATPALAQNTGGVFGPVVSEGHRSVQYRIGYDPDSDRFAQRLHYQQSIDGSKMARIVVQTRKTDDTAFDFDYVQGELFWQLTPDDAAWQQGLRFDARIRGDNRPGALGVNWMNQFQLSPNWRARALVLTSVELGENARDGVFLQTRAQLARKIDGGRFVGLEMFNAYGSTDNFPAFDDQSHRLGPFLSTPVTERFSLYTGALFGLTDGAPDVNLALWLTRRF